MSCVFRHVSEESADTKWHDVGETLLRLLWRYLMYLYTCSALCRNSSSRRVRIWMWWVAAWTLVFPCHTFASSPIAAMSHKVISSGVACLSLPAAPQYAQNVCIMFPCFFAFLSWSNSSECPLTKCIRVRGFYQGFLAIIVAVDPFQCSAGARLLGLLSGYCCIKSCGCSSTFCLAQSRTSGHQRLSRTKCQCFWTYPTPAHLQGVEMHTDIQRCFCPGASRFLDINYINLLFESKSAISIQSLNIT